ncbi:MAG: prepilin-type N-terminal cleavage/methylation domain-containing protein [Gemmatimonadetes bacterium]|nr:prepilin-type N-terminal cleavage/methylation domain-containing protein [Gemmatimonadota bacterium]
MMRRRPLMSASRRRRAGFTLIEIILALSILAGSLLGMAMFVRNFTKATTDTTVRTLANDLVNARVEAVKGWRVYSTMVATFNATTETWATTSMYTGFTRRTYAVRTGPTATADYVTVTVTVTGRGLTSTAKTTTIIAAF